MQRMPAELSFEQLTGKTSEEEVKEVFREAFLAVENAFLESVDPKIAERTQLLDKIPDGMSQFEAAQKFPDTVNRLQVGMLRSFHFIMCSHEETGAIFLKFSP